MRLKKLEDGKISVAARRRQLARWVLGAIASAIVVVPTTAAPKTEPVVKYGPAPSWERFKELAEAAVRMQLLDPDSARITWDQGYAQGSFKPFLSPRKYGYLACGRVNARNRMGGYAGSVLFAVLIDDDRVIHAEIGTPTGTDVVTTNCRAARFPSIASIVAAGSPPRPTIGFDFEISGGKIWVVSVAEGSPAAKNGLEVGMVLSHVNGISLQGLSTPMIQQMLDAAEGVPVVTTATGAKIAVPKALPVQRKGPVNPDDVV